MPAPTLDDYHWLVSQLAEPYLRNAKNLRNAKTEAGSLVVAAKQLRADLNAARTHLVLEQLELRDRARAKFPQADKMFFTRLLLEQSTDAQIASYKASRFPDNQPLADLCCGIGGDTLGLLQRGPCLAVDRDPVAALLLETNCQALGIHGLCVEVADVRSIVARLACAAWHIDPDRRAAVNRTSQAIYSEPGLDVIQSLLGQVDTGAMKLAPSAKLTDTVIDVGSVEREWIGSRRECRQQVLWFGKLATHAGQRTATVIDRQGNSHSFTGAADLTVDVAAPGCYLYVPDSTLLASQLTGALANQLELRAMTVGSTYYTSDAYHDSRLMEAFEVHESLSFDVKRLKQLLHERDVGRLEIKVRGVDVDPSQVRKRLQLRGSRHATLLIFRSSDRVMAAIAERCPPAS